MGMNITFQQYTKENENKNRIETYPCIWHLERTYLTGSFYLFWETAEN